MCHDPRRFEKMKQDEIEKMYEEPMEPFKAIVKQEQRQIEVTIIAKDPLDALDLIHALCNCIRYKMTAVPKWDVPERELKGR
jgi:hypothetical protein